MTLSEKKLQRRTAKSVAKKETFACKDCGRNWNTISGLIGHQKRIHKS